MKTLQFIDIQARKDYPSNMELIKKLKKKNPADLDKIMRLLHQEVFSEIDCMDCANCCRSLGPRISDKDIERLSRYLKIKPSQFTEKYLRIDEDQDYVFKSMPCPFIQPDNYCNVYDQRPAACRDYPHTDKKRMYQVLDLMLKNSYICPAVLEMLKRMRQESIITG